MSEETDHLRSATELLLTELLNAPQEIKENLPHILSETNVSLFTFATTDYLILSFLDSEERNRVNGLRARNLHPFPVLIRPTGGDTPVFFNLPDGTRNIHVGKLSLSDGFGFSLGRDCTFKK